jgi:hypothetical protein
MLLGADAIRSIRDARTASNPESGSLGGPGTDERGTLLLSAAPCFKETLEPGDHGDNRR